MIQSLPLKNLRSKIDHDHLGYNSTDELKPLEGIIGQDRAVKALKFGLNIDSDGFNIFVAGISGTGRMTGVKNFVEELAKTRPVPPDWCYVNNFKESYEPVAIKLPPGKARDFADRMDNFINSIKELLPQTFSSKDYIDKKEAITRSIKEEKDRLLQELRKEAYQQGFVLQATQIGFFLIPAVGGKPMSQEQYMNLSQEEKDKIQGKKSDMNKKVRETINKVRNLDRKINEEVKKLNHDVALYTIEKYLNDLKGNYNNNEEVLEYIKQVEDDILKNIIRTGIFPLDERAAIQEI